MTKKEFKTEINDALRMLENNDRHMEDCATFVKELKDPEVGIIAQKVQRQYGWDFSEVSDIFEKRVKLKLALFSGAIPRI
jgi:hypothetical protein